MTEGFSFQIGSRIEPVPNVGDGGYVVRHDPAQDVLGQRQRCTQSEFRSAVAGARRPGGRRRASLPGAMRTGSHCGRAAWRCWSGGTGRGDAPQIQPARLRRRQGVGTHRLDVAGARRPGKFQLNPIQERNLTAESPATAAQRPALYGRVAPSSPRRSVRLSLAAAASLASNTSASRVRFSSCSASTRSSTVPVAISL